MVGPVNESTDGISISSENVGSGDISAAGRFTGRRRREFPVLAAASP
jgi:hypothetical protein